MVMSNEAARQRRAGRNAITLRATLLGKLLRAVGFVNVDIKHSHADRQIVLVWHGTAANAVPLLRVIDPILERWSWPILDIWQPAEHAQRVAFCQIRIDVS